MSGLLNIHTTTLGWPGMLAQSECVLRARLLHAGLFGFPKQTLSCRHWPWSNQVFPVLTACREAQGFVSFGRGLRHCSQRMVALQLLVVLKNITESWRPSLGPAMKINYVDMA